MMSDGTTVDNDRTEKKVIAEAKNLMVDARNECDRIADLTHRIESNPYLELTPRIKFLLGRTRGELDDTKVFIYELIGRFS